MIHLHWWHWILVLYFGFGFTLCIFATGEMLCELLHQNEFPQDEDFRWWHIPKAYFECFFFGTGYLIYVLIKSIVEDIIEKKKNKKN